jgi:hypothetical protein
MKVDLSGLKVGDQIYGHSSGSFSNSPRWFRLKVTKITPTRITFERVHGHGRITYTFVIATGRRYGDKFPSCILGLEPPFNIAAATHEPEHDQPGRGVRKPPE